MKDLLLFSSMMCASCIASSDVIGEWELDVETTIQFNKENGQVSEAWKSLLTCMAKNSTLTINSDHYISVAKDHTCSHKGKNAEIEGYSIDYPHKIVLDNPDVTALVIINEEGLEFLEVIHKVTDDLIWMYYPGEPKSFDSHVRNYYKRKK